MLLNPDTREEKLAKVLNGIAVLAHIQGKEEQITSLKAMGPQCRVAI
jgi:hypothetical protein